MRSNIMSTFYHSRFAKTIPFFIYFVLCFAIHSFRSLFVNYSLMLPLCCDSSLPLCAGRRIPITLPNTGALARKRNSFYLRAILVICLVLFAVLQLHLINSRKYDIDFIYGNILPQIKSNRASHFQRSNVNKIMFLTIKIVWELWVNW